MENYSLSDIAAISKDGGFGGNNAWVLILLFAMIFGGGGFFGNRNDAATAASQQEILFGQQFQNLNSAINKVGDGLSSLGYSQLQTMNGMQSALGAAIVGEGRSLSDKLCECKTAIHEEGEATRALLQANKIESLQAQINALQLQAATQNTVKYPNNTVYTAGNSCFQNGCGNI